MKTTNSTCQCEHCCEIKRQQDRLEKWQLSRNKYNLFIEQKALEVRPDLVSQVSSQIIPVSSSTKNLSPHHQSKANDIGYKLL